MKGLEVLLYYVSFIVGEQDVQCCQIYLGTNWANLNRICLYVYFVTIYEAFPVKKNRTPDIVHRQIYWHFVHDSKNGSYQKKGLLESSRDVHL